MGEKFIICIGMTILLLFLPFGMTMLMTGYDKEGGEIKKSGIIVEYEEGGQFLTADLEEYMVGVLAAELPADYEEEVYLAQAIIVRTNARKLVQQGSNLKAEDLNMGYYSDEERREKLGETRYQEQSDKLKSAIASTYGMVLTYQGNYIDALYHQVSIGQTASALDVYGQDIPYLSSVDSSSDVESKDYMQTVMYSYEDVSNALSQILGNVSGDGTASSDAAGILAGVGITSENYLAQLAIAEKSPAGYVKQVKIGTQTVTGEQFKQAMNLNSLYFYMEAVDNQLRIVCLGKGHGLGMSQYGANQMAKEGADYEKILKHYYTEVEIEKIN